MRTASIIISSSSSIALLMETVCTSETSAYFNETTRHYIPEGYNIQTRCNENMKSHEVALSPSQKPTLQFILNHTNPVHTLTTYLFKIHLHIPSH